MKVREEMKKCFERKIGFWQKQFNSYPKVPYVKEYDTGLYIDNTIDEEGYVEWKPQEQNSQINEKLIELKLGVKLSDELAEFYSAYCFMELIGKLDSGIMINFDRILYGYDINEYIIQKHIENEKVREYCADFCKYDLFELGSAFVHGNDGYLICYDNNSGKVLLIYFVEKEVLDLDMSLCELLNSFVEVF